MLDEDTVFMDQIRNVPQNFYGFRGETFGGNGKVINIKNSNTVWGSLL